MRLTTDEALFLCVGMLLGIFFLRVVLDLGGGV